MGKLTAFFEALRTGSSLEDPALWKNRAAAVMAVSAFLVALLHVAKAYGYDTSAWLTADDISDIALGIVTVVGLYFNYATSKSVGVLPARPDAPVEVPTDSDGQGGAADDVHSGP